MLLLSRKTLTREIYFTDHAELIFIPNTLFWIPLAWGLWFHSSWVWFGVLCFLAGWLVVFFLFFNSYFWAAVGIVVYSLGWGGVGYALGVLCAHFLICAPPPLIVGILFYIISLAVFAIPLVNHYRHDKRRGQRSLVEE